MPLRTHLTAAGAPRAGRGWARYALLLSTASLAYACSHAWDDYNPRLTGTASSSASSSASGSSSSSSGLAEGGACTPPATRPCYTGKAGTSGNLPCQMGTQTCGDDGNWGDACVGQVTPLIEDCTNDADDDCNGTVNDHCGVWSMGFGVASAGGVNQVYGVAAAPQGQIRVVGGSRGGALVSADDGGMALSDASTGAFSIDMDAGPPASIEKLGGNASVTTAAAVDEAGGAILTSAVYGGQQLSILPLPGIKSGSLTYQWDSLVARLSGATGEWQTMMSGVTPSGAFVQLNAVTWNGGAHLYVAGAFTGTSDFDLDGGAPDAGGDAGDAGDGGYTGDDVLLTSKNMSGIVVRLDGNAQSAGTVWQAKLGDTGASVYAVTTAAGGTVVAAGSYSDNNLKIGPKAFPGTAAGAGMVVTLSDVSGLPQRVITYPSAGSALPVHVDSVVADPNAPEVIIAGRFSGAVQFNVAGADVTDGGPPIPDAGSDGGQGCTLHDPGIAGGLFVARLKVSDLSCRWVHTLTATGGFDGPPNVTPNTFSVRTQGFGPQVGLDAMGNVIVAANYENTVVVGDWTLTPVGTSSVLLFSLEPTMGSTVNWVRSFGTDRAYVTGMALDNTGAVLLVGQFLGPLQFEPDHLLVWPSTYQHDGIFIAKIAP